MWLLAFLSILLFFNLNAILKSRLYISVLLYLKHLDGFLNHYFSCKGECMPNANIVIRQFIKKIHVSLVSAEFPWCSALAIVMKCFSFFVCLRVVLIRLTPESCNNGEFVFPTTQSEKLYDHLVAFSNLTWRSSDNACALFSPPSLRLQTIATLPPFHREQFAWRTHSVCVLWLERCWVNWVAVG